MLIVGSGGFAKELFQIACETGEDVIFYNDFPAAPDFLFERFPVIHSLKEAEELFSFKPNFTLGLGNPKLRYDLYQKMRGVGGSFSSMISKETYIGNYEVKIGVGVNILAGTKISNSVSVGKGSMLYYNTVVTHDVTVGDFCEISPDVKLLGGCQVGNYTWIGAGSIIFPKVRIGDNAIIAAGSVVRENIPDNVMVAGIPAIIKKKL